MSESKEFNPGKGDNVRKGDCDADIAIAATKTLTRDVENSTGSATIVRQASEVPTSVIELCKETFQKSAEYVQGELEGTIEDYKLLEKMNKVTVCKYSEMKHIAMNIESALNDLNAKYKSLQPYLEQIDQIEDSVASLEQAAYSLDHYSKRLESKFKTLEKK